MTRQLSNEELFHFCEQLSIVLQSGLPAAEGLRILWEESEEAEDRTFLQDLLDRIDATGDFTGSLSDSGAFPSSMISYIRLGEQTGTLDEVMDILADYYEQETLLSGQIRNAVTYPLVMTAMMAGVLIILLVRVLPVFSRTLQQAGITMSGLSGGLLRLGRGLERYSVIFILLLAFLAVFVIFLACTRRGRMLTRRLVMRMPRFRAASESRDYSRLSQGISMGLHSGLLPENSMELSGELVENAGIRQKLDRSSELLREGASISDSLSGSGLFTGMEARLISVGFQSGKGDEIMRRLSKRYAADSSAQIRQAVAVLEPAIVITMTVLVGLILLSVMVPLLGILGEMI